MSAKLKRASTAACADRIRPFTITRGGTVLDVTRLTGLGALAVNLTCAFMMARFRHASGSLRRAAFLSARNDASANVAIVAAGATTMITRSAWPDLVVGLGILVMNLDAAREVYRLARREQQAAKVAT
jgi:Co/Zn/Cd efflux system component